MQKRTKIVCTLGPASEKLSTIINMVKAGMNVARLNFSHGTYDNHGALIASIHKAEEKTGEPVAIMQDLQGPKIRIGLLPEKGIILKEGQVVSFSTGIIDYENGLIPIDYADLHEHLKKGEKMLLDDGRIETKIIRISGRQIDVEVVVGGNLTSHKGINVPESKLKIRALTEKDRADAKFGVEQGVDLIALSFVTSAEDILDLRFLLKQYEEELKIKPAQPIKIIAKIERAEAIKNIKEIIEVADGIMVARGDLGIEVPAETVPLVQKNLIDLSLQKAKPVIVATQMLDSMQNNPRPTRAEVSDVANAVIDHTDAVMLSNETATGKYPVEAVEVMAEIIKETEKSVYDDLLVQGHLVKREKVDNVVSQLSRELAEEVNAKLILSASISGETGRLISRNRPQLPIVVGTDGERVRHQLNLSWGILPFKLLPCKSIEELVERSLAHLKKNKIVKNGDRIIVVSGEPVGVSGHVNLLEVREIS